MVGRSSSWVVEQTAASLQAYVLGDPTLAGQEEGGDRWKDRMGVTKEGRGL